MSSIDHGHESTDSGNKSGCGKLMLKIGGLVFALIVVPMETRGYIEEQSHLPSWQKDKGLVWNAVGIGKYMWKDTKSIGIYMLDAAKNKLKSL